VSWSANIRRVVVFGAVVTAGLVAGAFLSVSSAKERKHRTPPPVTREPPDAGAADATTHPAKTSEKHRKAKPDADRVRRAQPIPRDYVE
jgi:hypothetical protein